MDYLKIHKNEMPPIETKLAKQFSDIADQIQETVEIKEEQLDAFIFLSIAVDQEKEQKGEFGSNYPSSQKHLIVGQQQSLIHMLKHAATNDPGFAEALHAASSDILLLKLKQSLL